MLSQKCHPNASKMILHEMFKENVPQNLQKPDIQRPHNVLKTQNAKRFENALCFLGQYTKTNHKLSEMR